MTADANLLSSLSALSAEDRQRLAAMLARSNRAPVDIGICFFSSYGTQDACDQYSAILEIAEAGDRAGLSSIWIPERHFHPFGALYPNPSLLAAAIATRTSRIGIRAGSVVLPLHHPARVAEEWAMVDALSNGRVGVSIGTGWHIGDFVYAPQDYKNRATVTERNIAILRALWRGEGVYFPGVDGKPRIVHSFPRPKQAELPLWLTVSGSLESCVRAGRLGMNLFCSLIGATKDELRERIAAYRQARTDAGHAGKGWVTLMLHAYIDESSERVRDVAKGPLTHYFQRFLEQQMDRPDVVDDHSKIDAQVEFAVERYLRGDSLLGTPSQCLQQIEEVASCGVNEIAALVDFGAPQNLVLKSLRRLASLNQER